MGNFHLLFRTVVASILCCVASVAWSEPSTIEFRNLSWPSPFIIEISEDGSVAWRTGIDASGSGYRCPESSDYYCLILDGAWKFAVPRRLIGNPRIGETWQFDDVGFELNEIVRLRAGSNSGQSLVIKSKRSTDEVTFNFSATDGIQALSSLIPINDDLSEVVLSVWINTAMFTEDH